MSNRRDLLQVCSSEQMSAQEVISNWCSWCLNPECTRSQTGKSKFEDRVLHWEERIFLNPAQLDPTDARFQAISAKKFLTVIPGNSTTPSEWVDPRVARTEPVLISVPEQLLQPIPAPYEPPLSLEAPVLALASPVKPPVTSASMPILRNTPVQPRQMIAGASKTTALPVSDPWAPKPSVSPSGAQVVKPGAKIKLGGD